LPFEIWLICNDQPVRDDDSRLFGAMT